MKLLNYNSFRISLFLAAVFAAGFVSESAYNFSDTDRPLAIVRRFKPDVEVKHADGKDWIAAQMGEQLFNADTLRTNENGYAAVQFMDNSLVKVKPNSLLIINGEVNDKNSTATRLALEIGDIYLNVTKRRSNFEVATNSSVATVLGTTFGGSSNPNGSSRFWVASGTVDVAALQSGQKTSLKNGMYAEVGADGSSVNSGYLSKKELEGLVGDYDRFDDSSASKTMKLIFQNESGQRREVDVKYFKNEN